MHQDRRDEPRLGTDRFLKGPMPTGYHGPAEHWMELEAPLVAIDHVLEEFALRYAMEIAKNYHNWPSRALKWGKPLRRQISFYLRDEGERTFGFGLMAVEDRGRKRYWKFKTVRDDIAANELDEVVAHLLEMGRETVAAWSRDELTYAGDITPP